MTSSTQSKRAVYTLPHAVELSAPADLMYMTPYILEEQGDWFEHEIRWMRAMLQPGMNVLDIGANYGTYALSAAERVGPTGKVWAVEPTPSVVEHLERSKRLNEFAQLEIVPVALGAESGEISFFVTDNPELNAATKESERHTEIKVPCHTLDEIAAKHGIEQVDFLKLDAEGQETKILSKGSSVFEKQSPIVLFEISHGATATLDCWLALKAIGYQSYILCPATNVLIPIDPQAFDGELTLNLLACKPDRAASLEAAQLLCRDPKPSTEESPASERKSIKAYLQTTSYGRELIQTGLLEQPMSQAGHELYQNALDTYAKAMLEDPEPIEKTRLFILAYDLVKAACAQAATVARMLTLIRIAGQIHRQDIASKIVIQLAKAVQESEDLAIDEPFIIPAPDYDELDATSRIGPFIQSAILFQRITQASYSTYFELKNANQLLQLHLQQGIDHPNTTRRRQTILRLQQG